jgi:flagellar L-ring protein precursor FlgH
MGMHPGNLLRGSVALAIIAVVALPVKSALPKLKKQPKPEVTASAFDDYLKRVRTMAPATPETMGSLWVSSGTLASLSKDYKARNPGDLIVIHLVDNFTANTAGENKQSRQFSSSSALTGIVGAKSIPARLQNLFNANSQMSLDGKGQSTLSSNVSLNLAAQVMEVLQNGVLVVEATRDITVGNDRQTVIIRGLVRTGDLAPDNSIPSTSISNLDVEIKGKGAVADVSRQPNIVVRTLLRVLNF